MQETIQKVSAPKAIHKIYSSVLGLFRKNPALLAPFVIFTLLESIFLVILFLAPRQPFKFFFGPPIAALWGERYLHYPFNFVLLPTLASFSRTFLSVFAGSLLTGMAVMLAQEAFLGKHLKLAAAFKAVSKKYLSLLTIVLIVFFLFYGLTKVFSLLLMRYFMAGHSSLLFLKAGVWFGPFRVLLNFFASVVIQAFFVYCIPALIIAGETLSRAIAASFALWKRLPLTTFLLIGIPMLFYLPIIALEHNTSFLIGTLFPESVLLVCFAGTLLSSLAIDALVTVSAAHVFLQDRDSSKVRR